MRFPLLVEEGVRGGGYKKDLFFLYQDFILICYDFEMQNYYQDRLNNHKRFYNRRKFLRNNPTPQEVILWSYLKNSKIGFKFRRQHSVGGFILDFYCPEKRIAIELDGYFHNQRKEYDIKRDLFFTSMNIKVIRLWNNEIDSDIQKVLTQINNLLINHHP